MVDDKTENIFISNFTKYIQEFDMVKYNSLNNICILNSPSMERVSLSGTAGCLQKNISP